MSNFILGIAGGSGSGKTYFARALYEALGPEKACLIYQDNYYIDQSAKFDFDGGSVNFDHPSALDFDLLGKHLSLIKNNQSIEIPIYDFKTHSRQQKTIHQKPTKVILVDGILILGQAQVREHFTESVFVDTSEDLRFERRLKRDVEERGRTPEGVHNQFYKQVKPMHDQFVEPSKQFANYVILENQNYDEVFNSLLKKLF